MTLENVCPSPLLTDSGYTGSEEETFHICGGGGVVVFFLCKLQF